MRERVRQVLGEYADRARLCTFHEFAADIVGQHGSHLGIRHAVGAAAGLVGGDFLRAWVDVAEANAGEAPGHRREAGPGSR